LRLAHFPVRDEWQLRNRIISGYLMVRASPNGNRGGHFARRRLWARCIDGRPMDREELQAIALSYDQTSAPGAAPLLTKDPVPMLVPTLRYPVRRIPTWDLLTESAAHLADRLGMYSEARLASLLDGVAPGERVP
jgi:hypothetical protein